MKRFSLFCIFCAILTSPLYGGPVFTLSQTDLLSLSEVYDSPSGQSLVRVTTDSIAYNSDSSVLAGDVGFVGDLTGTPSSMAEIWLGNSGADLTGYDAYQLKLFNDNDDTWNVRLFVWPDDTDPGSAVFSGGWVPLAKGHGATLTVDVSTLGTVDSMGFAVGSLREDRFHISASPIPAPGALLLASMGMGLVGYLRRRRSL